MTSRAFLSYARNLLAASWEPTIDGRVESVPEPQVVVAGDPETKRVDPGTRDVIFIRDGGPETLTPVGVGHTHKRDEGLVSIDIRTTESRGRLEGVRDPDTNAAERYGGLRGEVERILDSVRKGDQEFDWIDGYEWNDLSEQVGFSKWRGSWEVRLTQIAIPIDPDPTPDS